MKPLQKVSVHWSPDFAYAVGLLATDGCLSKDKRHIDFTSKDKELIRHLQKGLKIEKEIKYKMSGSSENRTPHIQFSDVVFYRFLESIGFMPNKSKIISEVKVPKKIFF